MQMYLEPLALTLLPAVEWIDSWLVSVHFKLHSGGVFFDLMTEGGGGL